MTKLSAILYFITELEIHSTVGLLHSEVIICSEDYIIKIKANPLFMQGKFLNNMDNNFGFFNAKLYCKGALILVCVFVEL